MITKFDIIMRELKDYHDQGRYRDDNNDSRNIRRRDYDY